MPELTAHQMRGIELILEQQERFSSFRKNHREPAYFPVDLVVREFFETHEGFEFEMIVLNKIGRLLAPDSTENLNLEVYVQGRGDGTRSVIDNDAPKEA